jgi:dipeptidyl aminopeptidase/acylaminoacyl peptidase
MRTFLAVALLCVVGGANAQAYRPTPAELAEAYKRADALNADGRALNVTLAATWIGEDALWYRRADARNRHQFILANLKAKSKGPLFDHAALAKALGEATSGTINAEALPLTSLNVAADLSTVEFTASQKRWRWTRATAKLEPLTGTPPPEPAPIEEPEERPVYPWELARPEYEQGPPRARDGRSPDNKWTAEMKEGSLTVKAAAPDGPTRTFKVANVTDYEWARSSKFVVAKRRLDGDRKEVFLISSSPRNGGRATLERRLYDQPGDQLDRYEMWICDPETGEEKKLDVEPILGGGQPWASPPRLQWLPDDRFRLQFADRGYQRYRVIIGNPDGTVFTQIDEKSNTFVDTTSTIYRPLTKANEVLWRSERDGWGHLYAIDAASGAVKRQLTKGEWVVRSVEHIDEDQGYAIISANGRRPGEDPYHIHYYRVPLAGGEITPMTSGHGTHRAQWSPGFSHFVDSFSRVDLAPSHEVRDAKGNVVLKLEDADVSGLAELKLPKIEVFTAKGRDGKTDIWGIVVRPTNLDPTKKYPVVENIYAGPHDSHVPKNYTPITRMQRLAELGFIVVQMDGMGTRNRGKAFHDVCWKNVADAGFPDRKLWIQSLAKKYAYVDDTRVGIYGTSAGGQNSTGALLFHPEFYKVGVSSCGCHDNRMDKFWWNEHWMGYPVGKHYDEQSNITNAPKLQGRLLLLVGELDRNVPPESTLRLADALMRARKEFDLIVLPGMDHTDGGVYGERKRRDFFVRWLHGLEPPDWNQGQ